MSAGMSAGQTSAQDVGGAKEKADLADAQIDVPVNGSVRTPLALCCSEGLVEVTALLLLCGADPDVALKGTGETPLFLACEQGKPECAALLLMAGADPCRRRRDGYTPLDAAHLGKHTECIALIEECLAADNVLPSVPSFAAAVASFSLAAFARARGMIWNAQARAGLPSANPWEEAAPYDERAFDRCLERARAGGVNDQALYRLQAAASRLRRTREATREAALEEAKQRAAVEKGRAARERGGAFAVGHEAMEGSGGQEAGRSASSCGARLSEWRAGREDGKGTTNVRSNGTRSARGEGRAQSTSKTSSAAVGSSAAISFTEREARRRQGERERAEAMDALARAKYAAIEEERLKQLHTEGRRARQPAQPSQQPRGSTASKQKSPKEGVTA